MTGAGSTWNVGDPGFGLTLEVGSGNTSGPGTLTIANGGAVNVTASWLLAIYDRHLVGDGDRPGLGPERLEFAHDRRPELRLRRPLVGTLTVADGGVVNSPASPDIVAGSTLNLGNGGLAGAIVTPAIVNDGQIVANFTDTLSVAANISGTGTLSKAGAGTLILTGNNTYTGGTTIGGGTLQIGNGGTAGSIAGNVTNNATLAFNRSNGLTFGGVISGSGAVQQLGPGTTTLTANNTYTGGTVVNAGILQLGAGASLAAVGRHGQWRRLQPQQQQPDGGALAGTGGAIALGSGTLTAGDASNTTLARRSPALAASSSRAAAS